METVSSLIDKSLKLIGVLNERDKKQKQLSDFILFAASELLHLKEVLQIYNLTDHDGMQCWIMDQAVISARLEDLVDFYNLTVDKQHSDWTGLFGTLMDFVAKPYDSIFSDMEEVKQLIVESNRRVDSYKVSHVGSADALEIDQKISPHSKEVNAVGLSELIDHISYVISVERPSDIRTKVLCIFGAAGTGKSLLADAVYEQSIRNYELVYCAWVQLRGTGSARAIFEQILEQNHIKKPESGDLSKFMRELLLRSRFFFVIDGMETCEDWSHIMYAFQNDEKASRVIVTTTSMEMAKLCSWNASVFKMPPLSERSCNELLASKAYCGVGNSQIVAGAEHIIRTCEGLPLAIASFGNYIRCTKVWDEDICLAACQDIGALISNQKIVFRELKDVLSRNYNDLDLTARACLLSLSTYPVDHTIDCKSLMRRWQAEGLIAPDSFEASAESVLKCLHEKNFIVPIEVGVSGRMKLIRQNLLAKDFVRTKAKPYARFVESMSENIERQYNVLRFALNNKNPIARAIPKEDISHCRLFILYGTVSKGLVDLAGWTYLRVLVLEGLNSLTNECLNGISGTPFLKYLSVRGSKHLSKLPREILECHFLQTLDLRGTDIKLIRAEMLAIPNLVHLLGEFSFAWKGRCKKQLPLGKISKLETLSGFYVDGSPDFVKVLCHMPSLRKIRVIWRKDVEPDIFNELLLALKHHIEGSEALPICSLTVDFSGGCSLDTLGGLDLRSVHRVRNVKLCGRLSRLPRFLLSGNVTKLQLCSLDPGTGWSLLAESKALEMLKFLKIKEKYTPFPYSNMSPLPEFVFTAEDFKSLKNICLDMARIPKINFQGTSCLESIELICAEFGGLVGVNRMKFLEKFIISADVAGPGRVGFKLLEKQMRGLPHQPKLTKVQNQPVQQA